MPAAAFVFIAAVAQAGGVIRVAGAGTVLQGRVIGTVRVSVANFQCQRCAAEATVYHPGENFEGVGLLTRGAQGILRRGTPGHKSLQRVQIQRMPCRKTVDDHSDGPGMGLAEDRDANIAGIKRTHRPLLSSERSTFSPKVCRSSQNPG